MTDGDGAANRAERRAIHVKWQSLRSRTPEILRGAGIVASIAPSVALALGTGLVQSAPAGAEPSPTLADAVAQMRGGTSCPALQYDPLAEHTASIVNRSTDTYLSHQAENVPVEDAFPIYRDLGGKGAKVKVLLGAADNDGDATKGLLLQGFSAIPDCSFTTFGADRLWNADAGKVLLAVVLVGS
ncbi:hypothetical protein MANY_26100 [Mycolicibacterium anyangense]|uniref:Uncharacterized protein n=1 Tax=Mycolicibacterium anyangense TaxID=1431246 RepID=A0A6N4WA75_9MYCO|nr:hypothetical protein MANY_26100 [Mycolicibacterium anyangense]